MRALRLELAADYLVMAAWLAYPQVEAADPQAAGRRRRERRGAGGGAAVPPEAAGSHARRGGAAGQPQPARPRRVCSAACRKRSSSRSATPIRPSLYDLLTAYAAQRQRQAITNVTIARRGVWSLKDAREILTRLIGDAARLDGARQFPDRLSDHARKSGARRSPARSPRASKWCAKARSRSARTRRSRRSICAAGRAPASRQSRWHHERTRQRCRSFRSRSTTTTGEGDSSSDRIRRERLHIAEADAHGRGDRLCQRRAGQREGSLRAAARRHRRCRR